MGGADHRMAALTAEGLRTLAREATLRVGARGFVRFLPKGNDALLVTDALIHEGGDLARLQPSLEAAGFDARVRGRLLMLTPCDALLTQMAQQEASPTCEWDWDCAWAPACSLAHRWMRAPDVPLSSLGRALALETVRLLRQPQEQVLSGLSELRARSAVMQRMGEIGGLRLCGGILWNGCLRADLSLGRAKESKL